MVSRSCAMRMCQKSDDRVAEPGIGWWRSRIGRCVKEDWAPRPHCAATTTVEQPRRTRPVSRLLSPRGPCTDFVTLIFPMPLSRDPD